MPKRTFVTEKDVKAEVKKLLNKHGWFWWCPPGNGYGTSGVSDFNALKAGVFLAIETKKRPNKPTKTQTGYCQSIMAEGGFAFAVDETRLSTLDFWLSAFEDSVRRVREGGKPQDSDGAAMLDAISILTELMVKEKPSETPE